MLTAQQIIKQLGGATKVAAELNLPFTTVASWTAVNFIPAWRQPLLLALASRQGEALSTADFPTPDQRIPRTANAA